jgi:hypothetical protein
MRSITLQLSGTRRGLGLCLVASISLFADVARADEASGTWTGAIEGRGNYYHERSTRVSLTTVDANLSAPNGFRFGADYLVDVITSASLAQGVEEGQVDTELRHGLGAEVGKGVDLGSAQLEIDLHGSYSTEDDYESFAYGLRGVLALNDKNTKVRLSSTRLQDEIRSKTDPTFEDELDGLTLGAGVEQVLGPSLVISVGYLFGYLDGCLSNPYRIVPPVFPENHPDERVRHTASARLSWFVPSTDTAFHLLYSAYADSWDIAALNPELRIHQQLGEDVFVRPRYRFYTQTKAWFQMSEYPRRWDGPVTADPKTAAFQTHTLGASIDYRMSWLGGGAFADHVWLDVSVDRYWSTSAYGNGVIASSGARMEF